MTEPDAMTNMQDIHDAMQRQRTQARRNAIIMASTALVMTVSLIVKLTG